MTLLVLAYLGGILTILSPCVLPVLPFVFARAGRPFASSILPMLVGMALTFALVATLAAGGSVIGSAVLGVAVGFLWAPCAGPILGLILTGAALQGANTHTSLLLLTYAAGAATSLALALLVGGRVFQLLKRSLGAGEWVRRGLGVAVLAAGGALAFRLRNELLARVSLAGTSRIEQVLLDKAGGPGGGRPGGAMMMAGGNTT